MTAPPAPPIVWDGHSWATHEDWSFTVDGVTVRVPAGFRFDRASIPKLFRSLLDKDDLGLAGPLGHDWLYAHRGFVDAVPPTRFTRRAADRVLRQLCKAEGVGLIRRWLAFLAVRGFGWVPWPPSSSFVRSALLRGWNTLWQTAAGFAVAGGFAWPWWTVMLVATGLSLVKSLAIVPLGERVAGVLYK